MTQGAYYRDFIAVRLVAERERRQRLDDRSASVTTGSSALLTLIAALTALIVTKDVTMGKGPGALLLIALGLFATASGLSMRASMLMEYKVPSKDALQAMVDSHWTDTEASQLLACAWMDLDTLLSMRSVNKKKAWWLNIAL